MASPSTAASTEPSHGVLAQADSLDADDNLLGLSPTAYQTVDELLGEPELRGARLLACPDESARRRIRWVSVQELPFEDFVEPDELVLTTGVGLESVDDLVDIVRCAHQSQGAALAIAVGAHVREIPAQAIEEAERVGLPLIELPWALHFSAVSQAVFRHIVHNQSALLRHSEKTHEMFTQVVLKGADMPELCRMISGILGRKVWVVDRWGDMAGASSDEPGPQESFATVPVIAAKQELGRLEVGAPPGPLDEADLSTLEHAATAAALIFLIRQAAAASRAHDEAELATRLISGWIGSDRELARWMRDLALNPAEPMLILSLFITLDGQTVDEEELASWATDRALSARRLRKLMLWHSNELTLLIPTRLPGKAVARIIVTDVERLVRRHLPDAQVVCGVGQPAVSIQEINRRYREATVAAQLARSGAVGQPICAYLELGAYPALFEALTGNDSGPAFSSLHQRYLEPLAEYEKRGGPPLIGTLSVLFARNGNVSAAARQLGISRQSLLYRLERIRSLLGLDLGEPDQRFTLELGTRTWNMRPHALPGRAPSPPAQTNTFERMRGKRTGQAAAGLLAPEAGR